MNRVTHFELQVANPQKAIEFYTSVFGWKIEKFGEHDYWFVMTGEDGNGVNGGIMPSPDAQPRTFNTVEVDNVDDSLAKISEHGGEMVVPKAAIPGMGYVAYCKDPEGLIFGVFHGDENAQ
ncbi:VOC family protein [Paenisporosarcina sp. OV554]|uniref:VOC family protein n=1 Tax=Paenisporosarcina sp. OV554 TaxID=2135694 RepID=UPI000D34756C|nr:VOC family protein [Paenisporosarcina sp. OV554]PUB16725.1 hypothetical protein C8K15_102154 [Paenisporosarcina sp. OV554]